MMRRYGYNRNHHGAGEGVHDVGHEPEPEECLTTRLVRLLGQAAAHGAFTTPYRQRTDR